MPNIITLASSIWMLVEELDLQPAWQGRVREALQHNNFCTVKDVCTFLENFGPRKMEKLEGLGETSVAAIVATLQKNSLLEDPSTPKEPKMSLPPFVVNSIVQIVGDIIQRSGYHSFIVQQASSRLHPNNPAAVQHLNSLTDLVQSRYTEQQLKAGVSRFELAQFLTPWVTNFCQLIAAEIQNQPGMYGIQPQPLSPYPIFPWSAGRPPFTTSTPSQRTIPSGFIVVTIVTASVHRTQPHPDDAAKRRCRVNTSHIVSYWPCEDGGSRIKASSDGKDESAHVVETCEELDALIREAQ